MRKDRPKDSDLGPSNSDAPENQAIEMENWQ
jgi:hypothetical protein